MNEKQKLIVLPIDGNTLTTLQNYLQQGYVLHQIVNLNPTINSLLIVYYEPE